MLTVIYTAALLSICAAAIFANWLFYYLKRREVTKTRPRFEPIDTEPTRLISYGSIPPELPHFKAEPTDPEALQSPKSRKNRKAMRAAKQRRLTLKKQPK